MMKYGKYKSSGIDWIGKIPEHWEVKRGKDLLLERSIKNHPEELLLAASQKYGVVLKSMLATRSMEAQKDFENFKLVNIKDFVISLRSFEGGFEMALYKGIISPVYTVFSVNRNQLEDYYKHLFKSVSFISNLKTMITGIRDGQSIKFVEVQNSFFPTPTKEEQAAIALYLDAKTQAIEKKINLLTQKANYYIELRKSIINDAVCKGLDKKVKLKEGDYLFPVNTNWKRYRLKDLGFLYSGLSGKVGDDFNQDDNPNNKGFIPFTNIANNTYLKANHLGTVVLGENEKQNKVRKGDIFFLMSSEGYEDIGKSAVLAEDIKDTYLNSFCKGYRITKKFCEPYFLNYLLLSDNYRKSLITEGKGFTRINLKMEKVTDFFVYLPTTKEEQTTIANYLDEKTQKIDAIVANICKQIETLKELRKTLINDVVTGKIKVVNN